MRTIHHDPYIPANQSVPEFTLKAVLLGCIFGLLFGATTVYLALKVGLTVSASIPIAVLAIALFKRFGHSTILENNIVQTVGSAGESVAAGVAFTLPALLFLSAGAETFHYFQIFILALCGGALGVLFMIPLRKTLIVQEHGVLPYPEGTACADVLIAGEKGGNLARQVYAGIAVAAGYKLLMSIFGFWKEIPRYVFGKQSALPNGSLSVEVSPELLGVGYIIGIRSAGIMVAGGILSALVMTPLITYFGAFVGTAIAPGKKLIGEMSPTEIWSSYIRYIGAGAVTFAGIVTMVKTIPTIIRTFRKTYKDIKNRGVNAESRELRTEKDLSLLYVVFGSLGMVIVMALLPSVPVNLVSAVLVVVASFFFVTVSSRIVGIIGTSSNPISGMTIATLMGTSLIFIASGWIDDIYQPIALCVGAIVAIAAANAGATAQDLKTGFLVGATPSKQQIGMIIGVAVSAVAVGLTIILLKDALGFGEITPEHQHPLPAPQAMLMSTIIKGLFNQSLPWSLVLVGMGLSAVVELCGVSSLAFAVGTYLPLATTAPIFIGGCLKWLVTQRKKINPEESELESGALFSSGLIAGGALMGILIAFLLGTQSSQIGPNGRPLSLMDLVNTEFGEKAGSLGDILGIVCFALMGAALFYSATRKNNEAKAA